MIRPHILVFALALVFAAHAQAGSPGAKVKSSAKDNSAPPAEDISGMYSFVNPGEYLQINLETDGVSGYISRMGDLSSDRGTFLDQFFDKASVQGHDVSFTTKILHGEWFEFKGRFERGHAKTKAEDGFYILRGTLTQYSSNEDEKNPASHARQIEFKWMAQPQDVEEKKPKSKVH